MTSYREQFVETFKITSYYENFEVQACCRSDGYDLLGMHFRPDDYQGLFWQTKVFWRKYVSHETIVDYMEGVRWLENNSFNIYVIVIDGLRDLGKALRPYPVQMCQFHQILVVRLYLTNDPDPEASRQLLDLVKNITQIDKESFVGAFKEWQEKYRNILDERVCDRRIKRRTPPYMCPRLWSTCLLKCV